VHDVIAQLTSQVETGEWSCGARIPTEEQLAATLGVGRNTVREAVRSLVHIGMLEVRQGAGTFVRTRHDPSAVLRRVQHSILRDRLEVRRALEVEAAALAALRRTPEELAEIRRALDQRGDWSDDASLAEFVERDARFHISVARASHNAALIELYGYFQDGLRDTIAGTESRRDIPEPSLAAHEAIYEAIRDQDATAAAGAANRLLAPAIEAAGAADPGVHGD
jgi:DNA-binding FadR family transcriptional regulator